MGYFFRRVLKNFAIKVLSHIDRFYILLRKALCPNAYMTVTILGNTFSLIKTVFVVGTNGCAAVELPIDA